MQKQLTLSFMFLTLLLLKHAERAQGVAKNQPDFNALCTVYSLAASVAKLQPDGTKPDPAAAGTLSEINFLNITVSDQSFYENGNISEGIVGGDSGAVRGKWKVIREGLAANIVKGDRVVPMRKTPDSPSQARAARQIGLILKEAEKHFEDYTNHMASAGAQYLLAKETAKQAIFGGGRAVWDNAEALEPATFSGWDGGADWRNGKVTKDGAPLSITSGKGCGHNGGEDAGISIIADITCLCIGRPSNDQNAQMENSCADGLGSFTQDFGSNTANLVHAANGWGKIRPFCESIPWKVDRPSASRLVHSVETYLTGIGRSTAESVGGEASLTNCGVVSGASTGICLNYKKMIKGKQGYKGIPWVKLIYETAAHLEAAADELHSAGAQLTRLRLLNTTAWGVFAATSAESNLVASTDAAKDVTKGYGNLTGNTGDGRVSSGKLPAVSSGVPNLAGVTWTMFTTALLVVR